MPTVFFSLFLLNVSRGCGGVRCGGVSVPQGVLFFAGLRSCGGCDETLKAVTSCTL